MPLEIYAYRPSEDPSIEEEKKWVRRATVYPGEEVQIPSYTYKGRMKFMRIKVKPDDSMSTVHTIYPTNIIIRDRNSEIPSQIEFDDNETENLPTEIRKGESHEIFSRTFVAVDDNSFTLKAIRGKLTHK
jgi:hypothetical protein